MHHKHKDSTESHGFVTVNVFRKKDNKWYNVVYKKPNLLANEGRDHMHDQVYISLVAGTRGFNFMALSSDTNAVSATHTAKGTGAGSWDATGMEITATGLVRVELLAGEITHTLGTNSTEFDHTFENQSGAAVNDIQKVGLFNDTDGSASELLGHEASFTPQDLADGDKLQIIYTLNLG